MLIPDPPPVEHAWVAPRVPHVEGICTTGLFPSAARRGGLHEMRRVRRTQTRQERAENETDPTLSTGDPRLS
ncbi:hypothetical protein AOLI_G00225180 [Acnodon oligacanthus]